jgi:malonyl-CoA O-methyltransferase
MNSYPIILLHGWGFSSRIWRPLMQALHARGCDDVYVIDMPGFGSAYHEPCESLEQVLDTIVEQLPEKSVLCGWSLGGMLALKIAERWPEKIARIVTIGSNLHFTAEDKWPGMPLADYQQFCQRFSTQPEKTWQRFLSLQTRNDSDAALATTALELLADYSVINPHTAEKMLVLLGNTDCRPAFAALGVPGLHILGGQDAITPVAIAPLLHELNATQEVQILPGSAHAMPVSHAAQLAESIAGFFLDKKQAVKKSRIADSFSRAASSYDTAAKLQRNVGTALLGALPGLMSGTVIDIGCGTGFITGELLRKYGNQINLLALDFATGMLQRTHQNHAGTLCVQADMELLPFADDSADWLVSSLALQWARNPALCFQQWRRALKPGGNLFFSTFLPGTLLELEQSWSKVDAAVHVNRFVADETLLAALHIAGFSNVETVRATHTLYYPALRELAKELKAIGAHNMNEGQPTGLTGKRRWLQLQSAYESLRTERGLPATYEVLYVSAS